VGGLAACVATPTARWHPKSLKGAAVCAVPVSRARPTWGQTFAILARTSAKWVKTERTGCNSAKNLLGFVAIIPKRQGRAACRDPLSSSAFWSLPWRDALPIRLRAGWPGQRQGRFCLRRSGAVCWVGPWSAARSALPAVASNLACHPAIRPTELITCTIKLQPAGPTARGVPCRSPVTGEA